MKQEHPRVEFIHNVAAKLNALLVMIDVLAPFAKDGFLSFFRGIDQKLPYLTELNDAYSGENKEVLTITATYCKGVPPDVFEVTLDTELLEHVQRTQTPTS